MAKLTGGAFTKKDVSPTFVYLLMVYNWRHLSKNVRKADKDQDALHKDVSNHDIEAIQKDLASMDKELEDAGKDGHKLAYRSLLLLRMAIFKFRLLAHSAKEHFEKDKRLQSQLLKRNDSDKQIRDLLEQEGSVETFVSERVAKLMAEFKHELKDDRRALLNLYARGEGKGNVAFAFKGDPKSVGHMLNIRVITLPKLRKAVRAEEKAAEKLETDEKNLYTLQDKVARLQSEGDVKQKAKAVREEKKSLDKVLNDFKELFKQIEKVITLSHKIFIFDFLLLRSVLDMIDNEEKYDQQLMEKHVIPQSMGVANLGELKAKKQQIKEEVDSIEKFVLQLLRQ